MRNITRPTGAKGAFYCDIIGQPIPQIQWIKDEKIMTDATGRIHIETGLWGSSLRVDQVRKSDEGTYTCMAINPSGAINATAYLRVTEKGKGPLFGQSAITVFNH
ncbi:unnamed protein product [Dicrocoelium dendriticum]|nr:unnamed protein product [Dicrocoelium dendriticum]